MPTTIRDLSGNNAFGVQLSGGDLSGNITTGGSAQSLSGANGTRKGVTLQNISAGDLWVREGGTAAIDGQGSYKIAAGEVYQSNHAGALSIIGATTGQKFSASEF